MATKAFSSTDTHTQAFYDFLHQQGVTDQQIDGQVSQAPGVKQKAKVDGKLSSSEVFAYVFKNLTDYAPKLQEHFKKLGLELDWMQDDGSISPKGMTRVINRLQGAGRRSLVRELKKIKFPDDGKELTFRDARKLQQSVLRSAFQNTELALLPLDVQERQLRKFIGQRVQNPDHQDRVLKDLKKNLIQANRGMNPEGKVAHLSVLKGGEVFRESVKQKKAGNQARADALFDQARNLFQAAVELDPRNGAARRFLAIMLVRQDKVEEARGHVEQVLRRSGSRSEITKLIKLLGKDPMTKVIPEGQTRWGFIGDNFKAGRRFKLAQLAYKKAAKNTKDPALKEQFRGQADAADEAAHPYRLGFNKKAHPVAHQFYHGLKKAGVTGRAMDQKVEGKGDRKISVQEVYDYIGNHLEDDPRVAKLLEKAGIKLELGDGARIKGTGFGRFMAERHSDEARRLAESNGKPKLKAIQENHWLAIQFEPQNPARYEALGDFHVSQGNHLEAMGAFAAGLEAHPQNAELKQKLSGTHEAGLQAGREALEKLGDKASVGQAEEIFARMKGEQVIAKQFLGKKADTVQNLLTLAQGQTSLAKIYEGKGEAKLAQKAYEGAIEQYTAAIKVDPKCGEAILALLERSRVHDAMGNYQLAYQDLTSAVTLHPIDIPGGYMPTYELMQYERDLGEKLQKVSADRAKAEQASPPDFDKLDALLTEEMKLHEALGHEDQAKEIKTRLSKEGTQRRLDALTGEAGQLVANGMLNADSLAKFENLNPEGLKALSQYVSLKQDGDVTVLKYSRAFEKLEPKQKQAVLSTLLKAGQWGDLKNLAYSTADPYQSFYYSARMTLLEGDEVRAHRMLKSFLKDSGPPNPMIQVMRQQATQLVSQMDQENLKLREQNLGELTQLLGSVVNPLLRKPDGSLNLSKIRVKSFDEFKKFMDTQVSVDGMAGTSMVGDTVKIKDWFDAYHRVVGSDQYEPLLRMLYAEIAPIPQDVQDNLSSEQATELLHKFREEYISVSPSRYVNAQMATQEGRERLRKVLSDSEHYSKDTRAYVVRAIAGAGDDQNISFLHSHAMKEFASGWDIANIRFSEGEIREITEEEVQKATHHAKEILEIADDYDQRADQAQARYLENPEEVRVLPSHVEGLEHPITPQRIRSMAQFAKDHGSSKDPAVQMQVKLAKFWLMAVDGDHWVDENSKASYPNRAYLVTHAERLFKQAQGVKNSEDFIQLAEDIDEFMGSPVPSAGKGVLADAGHFVGATDTVEDMFTEMSAPLSKPFQDLSQFTDEMNHSLEMGMQIEVGAPEVAAEDKKIRDASITFIQGLEGAKRSLWHGYKQHHGASRVLATAGDVVGVGDRVDIREANAALDRMITRLKGAQTQEDLLKEVQHLSDMMKEGGVLNNAFVAAEMNLGEHLLQLSYTVLEAATITYATAGAGAGLALARATATVGTNLYRARRVSQAVSVANRARQAMNAVGTVYRYERAGQMIGAAKRAKDLAAAGRLERMADAAGRGMYVGSIISAEEYATSVVSGQVQAERPTILRMLKQAMSTGLAMGAIAPLGGIAAQQVEGNIVKNLYLRYTANGARGARTFLKDTGLETVEEVLDNYTNKFLDGDASAMSWDEMRDIVTICFAGGGMPMGAKLLAMYNGPGSVAEARANQPPPDSPEPEITPPSPEPSHPTPPPLTPVPPTGPMPPPLSPTPAGAPGQAATLSNQAELMTGFAQGQVIIPDGKGGHVLKDSQGNVLREDVTQAEQNLYLSFLKEQDETARAENPTGARARLALEGLRLREMEIIDMWYPEGSQYARVEGVVPILGTQDVRVQLQVYDSANNFHQSTRPEVKPDRVVTLEMTATDAARLGYQQGNNLVMVPDSPGDTSPRAEPPNLSESESAVLTRDYHFGYTITPDGKGGNVLKNSAGKVVRRATAVEQNHYLAHLKAQKAGAKRAEAESQAALAGKVSEAEVQIRVEIVAEREAIAQEHARVDGLTGKEKTEGQEALDKRKAEFNKRLSTERRTPDGIPYQELMPQIAGTLIQGVMDGTVDRVTLREQMLEQLEVQGVRLSNDKAPPSAGITDPQVRADNAKAVDSIIDFARTAKKHGILGVEGGLTQEQFGALISDLYLHGAERDGVSITRAELTHVPMVAEGTVSMLRLDDLMNDPDVSVRKQAFVTALLHDAGKAQLGNLTTTQDWTLPASSFFNPTGVNLTVKAGQTFAEAIEQHQQDPALLDQIIEKRRDTRAGLETKISQLQAEGKTEEAAKLQEQLDQSPELTQEQAAELLGKSPLLTEKVAPLIGIIAHHDSAAVHDYLTGKLVEQGVLTEAEALEAWQAIERHALVSSWINDNSVGGMGVLTAIYNKPEHARFLDLYTRGADVKVADPATGKETTVPVEGLSHLLAQGVDIFTWAEQARDGTAPLSKEQLAAVEALREFQENFRNNFSPLERAMLLGDHTGQVDIAKYMMILLNVGPNAKATVGDLFFQDSRTNGVQGVLETHRDELRLFMGDDTPGPGESDIQSPDRAGRTARSFNRAIDWMNQTDPTRPGLAKAVLSNPRLAESFKNFQGRYAAWLDHYSELSTGDVFKDWLGTMPIKDDQGNPTQNFKDIQAAVEPAFYDFSNLQASRSNFNLMTPLPPQGTPRRDASPPPAATQPPPELPGVAEGALRAPKVPSFEAEAPPLDTGPPPTPTDAKTRDTEPARPRGKAAGAQGAAQSKDTVPARKKKAPAPGDIDQDAPTRVMEHPEKAGLGQPDHDSPTFVGPRPEESGAEPTPTREDEAKTTVTYRPGAGLAATPELQEEYDRIYEHIESHRSAFETVMKKIREFMNTMTELGIVNTFGRLKDVEGIPAKLEARGITNLDAITDVAATTVVFGELYAPGRDVFSTTAFLEVLLPYLKENGYSIRQAVDQNGDPIFQSNADGSLKTDREGNPMPVKKFDSAGRAVAGKKGGRGLDTGYRAVHLVIDVDGKPVEIQLKTEAMRDWGDVQHDVYKNEAELEGADLAAVNDFFKKSADYLADLEQGAAVKPEDMPTPPQLSQEVSGNTRGSLEADFDRMTAVMIRFRLLSQSEGLTNLSREEIRDYGRQVSRYLSALIHPVTDQTLPNRPPPPNIPAEEMTPELQADLSTLESLMDEHSLPREAPATQPDLPMAARDSASAGDVSRDDATVLDEAPSSSGVHDTGSLSDAFPSLRKEKPPMEGPDVSHVFVNYTTEPNPSEATITSLINWFMADNIPKDEHGRPTLEFREQLLKEMESGEKIFLIDRNGKASLVSQDVVRKKIQTARDMINEHSPELAKLHGAAKGMLVARFLSIPDSNPEQMAAEFKKELKRFEDTFAIAREFGIQDPGQAFLEAARQQHDSQDNSIGAYERAFKLKQRAFEIMAPFAKRLTEEQRRAFSNRVMGGTLPITEVAKMGVNLAMVPVLVHLSQEERTSHLEKLYGLIGTNEVDTAILDSFAQTLKGMEAPLRTQWLDIFLAQVGPKVQKITSAPNQGQKITQNKTQIQVHLGIVQRVAPKVESLDAETREVVLNGLRSSKINLEALDTDFEGTVDKAKIPDASQMATVPPPARGGTPPQAPAPTTAPPPGAAQPTAAPPARKAQSDSGTVETDRPPAKVEKEDETSGPQAKQEAKTEAPPAPTTKPPPRGGPGAAGAAGALMGLLTLFLPEVAKAAPAAADAAQSGVEGLSAAYQVGGIAGVAIAGVAMVFGLPAIFRRGQAQGTKPGPPLASFKDPVQVEIEEGTEQRTVNIYPEPKGKNKRTRQLEGRLGAVDPEASFVSGNEVRVVLTGLKIVTEGGEIRATEGAYVDSFTVSIEDAKRLGFEFDRNNQITGHPTHEIIIEEVVETVEPEVESLDAPAQAALEGMPSLPPKEGATVAVQDGSGRMSNLGLLTVGNEPSDLDVPNTHVAEVLSVRSESRRPGEVAVEVQLYDPMDPLAHPSNLIFGLNQGKIPQVMETRTVWMSEGEALVMGLGTGRPGAVPSQNYLVVEDQAVERGPSNPIIVTTSAQEGFLIHPYQMGRDKGVPVQVEDATRSGDQILVFLKTVDTPGQAGKRLNMEPYPLSLEQAQELGIQVGYDGRLRITRNEFKFGDIHRNPDGSFDVEGDPLIAEDTPVSVRLESGPDGEIRLAAEATPIPKATDANFKTLVRKAELARALIAAEEQGLTEVDPEHLASARQFLDLLDDPRKKKIPPNPAFLEALPDFEFLVGEVSDNPRFNSTGLVFKDHHYPDGKPPEEMQPFEFKIQDIDPETGNLQLINPHTGKTMTVKGIGKSPIAHPFQKGDAVVLLRPMAGGSPKKGEGPSGAFFVDFTQDELGANTIPLGRNSVPFFRDLTGIALDHAEIRHQPDGNLFITHQADFSSTYVNRDGYWEKLEKGKPRLLSLGQDIALENHVYRLEIDGDRYQLVPVRPRSETAAPKPAPAPAPAEAPAKPKSTPITLSIGEAQFEVKASKFADRLEGNPLLGEVVDGRINPNKPTEVQVNLKTMRPSTPQTTGQLTLNLSRKQAHDLGIVFDNAGRIDTSRSVKAVTISEVRQEADDQAAFQTAEEISPPAPEVDTGPLPSTEGLGTPPPDIPREGETMGFLAGGATGGGGIGKGVLIPRNGTPVVVSTGTKEDVQVRYNPQTGGYEYRFLDTRIQKNAQGQFEQEKYNRKTQQYETRPAPEAKAESLLWSQNWDPIAIGERLDHHFNQFVLTELNGIPVEREDDYSAILDLDAQIEYQLATQGISRHLQQRRVEGHEVNDLDVQNLANFFSPNFLEALKSYDSGQGNRRIGGIFGGNSVVYAMVDPKTGAIHRFATRTPRESEANSRPLWELQQDTRTGRLMWIDKEGRNPPELVQAGDVPPGAVVVPITYSRMVGTLNVDARDLKGKNLSEEARQRLENIDGIFAKPGTSHGHFGLKYIGRIVHGEGDSASQGPEAAPAPPPSRPAPSPAADTEALSDTQGNYYQLEGIGVAPKELTSPIVGLPVGAVPMAGKPGHFQITFNLMHTEGGKPTERVAIPMDGEQLKAHGIQVEADGTLVGQQQFFNFEPMGEAEGPPPGITEMGFVDITVDGNQLLLSPVSITETLFGDVRIGNVLNARIHPRNPGIFQVKVLSYEHGNPHNRQEMVYDLNPAQVEALGIPLTPEGQIDRTQNLPQIRIQKITPEPAPEAPPSPPTTPPRGPSALPEVPTNPATPTPVPANQPARVLNTILPTSSLAQGEHSPEWVSRMDNRGGIALGAHRGMYKTAHNEDRTDAVVFADGRTWMVAVDGISTGGGGERGGEISRAAIVHGGQEGMSAEAAMQLADGVLVEDNIRHPNQVDPTTGKPKVTAPGAVAVVVEAVPKGNGQYDLRALTNGDSEALAIRPGNPPQIILHTTRATEVVDLARQQQGQAPLPRMPDGRLPRGYTMVLQGTEGANVVTQALGHGDNQIYETRPETTAQEGDIILVGSDGLFENFGSKDTIMQIVINEIQRTGRADPAHLRDVLVQESLIRMSLHKNARGQPLTHEVYVQAYRDVTGQEPPAGWRGFYEPFTDGNGVQHSYSLNHQAQVVHDGSGQRVDRFKRDNVSVGVQVLGQPVAGEVTLDPNQGVGQDLASFMADKPTIADQHNIPGMTPDRAQYLEGVFARGGILQQVGNEYRILDFGSGAHTIEGGGRASEADVAFYNLWKQERSFPQVDVATAQQAWSELQERAQALGIKIGIGLGRSYLPDEGPKPATVESWGGPIVQVNNLLKLLPDSMLKNLKLRGIRLNTERMGPGKLSSFHNNQVYLFSGTFSGDRRHLTGMLLHELGHSTAERYELGPEGDATIPQEVRQRMNRAHAILGRAGVMIGLDHAGGPEYRKSYQAGTFSEFLAEMNLIYVAAGPMLRQHIESFPEGSEVRQAWEFVYNEMQNRIFDGREYGYL